MNHSLKFSTLISVLKGYSVRKFKMFLYEEKCVFNFNIDSRIILSARAHYLWYVESKQLSHGMAFSDF